MSEARAGRAPARRAGSWIAAGCLAFGALMALGNPGTQDAVANGDTRTITIEHEHTKETASVTFLRNGQYDPDALKQLNWMLRDWRLDEPTRMDPRLFDIVWQVYREVGAREPIHVVSAYRAPETNAALRRRSRAVAEHSQHMLGKAMDFYIPDVSMARVREIGMRLQRGGVGFYPNAMNPFVHLDAGSVRSWPRMSGDQLARLFPDGRTVHMPRHGKPLPGYEDAKAMIIARGGTVAGMATYADAGEEAGPRKSLWATLFGGNDDEDSDFYRAQPDRQAASRRVASYAPASGGDDAGIRSFFPGAATASPAGRRDSLPTTPPPGLETTAVAVPAAPPPTVPLPPRRPRDIAVAAFAPLTRPVTFAAAGPAPALPVVEPRGEMRAPARALASASLDDRAALKSLFAAAATPSIMVGGPAVQTTRARVEPVGANMAALRDGGAKLRMTFSSATLDAPEAGAFSGPAVVPLVVLR